MPALSIMIKPASSLCNLKCQYCFYHSLSASRQYKDYGIMDSQTSLQLIQKALDFANGDSIYFAFQGGEPLLAKLEYFENFVETVQRLNHNNTTIYYSLQTNGTLIDQKWATFFGDNNFLIGLSLDGDQNANRYRVDQNLDYTFPKVFKAAQLLKEQNVQFNILTVATGYTAEHISTIYNFFKDNNFKHLQFIPCLRPFGDKSESMLYMNVNQYTQFLITLFNHYVKDYVRGNYISIRQFDNMVALYLGQKCEQCGTAGHCSHQFVIEAGGNVYPCDFYCVDDLLIGNINNDNFDNMAHSKLAIDFIQESFNSMPKKCLECRYFNICRGGGCKRSRHDRDYCQSYMAFFDSCLPLFKLFNQK